MSSKEAVGLESVRCRRPECARVLARLRLEAHSQVEIKCPRCKVISVFASQEMKYRLRPDGTGGYIEVPISD